ncbi:MAG TPA: hypothetical protein VKV80_16430 [Streptosporangiaceae bacterium]|nr:hypothetical protein [Streptosporangiaceae bacterium]
MSGSRKPGLGLARHVKDWTSGNAAVSFGGPGEHAACDAVIARLRARAEAAEAKLAALGDAGEDRDAGKDDGRDGPTSREDD